MLLRTARPVVFAMGGAAAFLLCLAGLRAQAPAPSGEQADALARFLAGHEPGPVRYRAVRRLSAVAGGGKMSASLTAITSLEPDAGFTYHVVEESGSGVIRARVLRAALEAERRTLASDEPAGAALTEANYEFGPGGEAAGLIRVPLRPRRSGAFLIDGQMWLTDAGDLLQVDGSLVKRPSFWTRHVQVVRRWARIAGVRVPVAMESIAQVRIVGPSTFMMTYEYESINGAPVTPAP